MKKIDVKSHTFYGKRYRIKFIDLSKDVDRADLEYCAKRYNIDDPNNIIAMTDTRTSKDKSILISSAIKSEKELLRVLLDEGLHACDDRLDNDVVDVYARDLSSFLWRCGYRITCKQAPGLNS